MKTVSAESGVYKLLFGRSPLTGGIAMSAIIFSIAGFMLFELPALIPLRTFPVPTIPCDYQAVAGIVFFMSIILRKPWQILRFPRHNSVPFVIGLTWHDRQELCKTFTKRKMSECLVFLGVFFAVRYILILIFDHDWTITGMLLPEIPVFVLLWLLYSLSDRIVCAIPYSEKEYVVQEKRSSGSAVISKRRITYMSIAKFIVSWISKPVHTVAVRMILYVIRRDAFGTLFLHTAGIILCTVMAVLLPQSVEVLSRIVLIAAPVFLFGEHREQIVASIGKTIDCPCWSFTSRQIMLSGTFLYATVAAPYALIFIIRQIVNRGAVDFAAVVNFFLATAALCTVAGKGFFFSAWEKKDNGGELAIWAASLILCTLMPLLGVAFSAVLLAVNSSSIYRNNFQAQRRDG